ncbi:MAG: hypothetical protein IKN71_03805, partial [Alphaproteobacteria bacterium]|nr:hypothetical protein [Alphaproteobacteria bacterium]
MNNSGTIGKITGDFIDNKGSEEGGAIRNTGSITAVGDFIGNTASSSLKAYGGAIYTSKELNVRDALFANNKVVASSVGGGGAIQQIWGSGSRYVDITAMDTNVVFQGNTVTSGGVKTYNDITQGNPYSTDGSSSINLNALRGQSINFGGTIVGKNNLNDHSILNLNQDEVVYGGEYNFNNSVKYHTINIGTDTNKASGATINLGKFVQDDGSVTYGSFYLDTIVNNALSHINMQNNHVGADEDNILSNLTLNKDLGIGIDVKLGLSGSTQQNYADTLKLEGKSSAISGDGRIVIDSINMTNTKYSDSGKTATVQITDTTNANNKAKYVLADDIQNNITGNNYFTKVEYDGNGNLVFSDKLVNESALNETLASNYYTKAQIDEQIPSVLEPARGASAAVKYVESNASDTSAFKLTDPSGDVRYYKAIGLRESDATSTTNISADVTDGYYEGISGAALKVAENSTISTINADFKGGQRGVENSAGSTITNLTGDFNNMSGNAVYNNGTGAKITNIKSNIYKSSTGVNNSSGAEIGTIDGTFANNTSASIYNSGDASKINTITGKFDSNVSGTVLSNISGTITTIDAEFTNNDMTGSGKVVSNTNKSTITNLKGRFENNKYGDATVYLLGSNSDNKSVITNIIADFVKNESKTGNGYGAIYLDDYSYVDKIQGDFTENKARYAGAIYLDNPGTSVGTIAGKFIGNKSTGQDQNAAGAITNYFGSITSISGEFTDNSASGGAGAIGNYGTIGTITADFTNNKKTVDSWNGGALTNTGSITTLTGNFTGNSSNFYAGAIRNTKTIETINGDFTENVASDNGGAIYNNGANAVISTMTGDFVGNRSGYRGGAIYNESGSSITKITGDFRDNKATSSGGAIYNKDGTIGLLAKSDSITFYNNKAGGAYNDIANTASTSSATSTINMNAASGKSISFGGTIDKDNSTYSYSNGTININNSTDQTERGGQYVFNNTVSNQTINLYNSADVKLGSIKQADGTTAYGKLSSTLNNISGTAMIDMRNERIGTDLSASAMTLGTNSAKADLKVALDVSMNEGSTEITNKTKTGLGDTITAGSATFNKGSSLIIDAINLNSSYYKNGVDTVKVNLTSSTALKNTNVKVSEDILNNVTGAANYYTDIKYDDVTGELVFTDKLVNMSTLNAKLSEMMPSVLEPARGASAAVRYAESNASDTSAFKLTDPSGDVRYYKAIGLRESDATSTTNISANVTDGYYEGITSGAALKVAEGSNISTINVDVKDGKVGVENTAGSTITNLTGDFNNINTGNNSSSYAVYNHGTNAQITNIKGNFYKSSTGIQNESGGKIETIDGTFANSTYRAISNILGEIGTITGKFDSNKGSEAVLTNMSSTITTIDAEFTNNDMTGNRNVVSNTNKSTITNLKGRFENNKYGNATVYLQGNSSDNKSVITNIIADFVQNEVNGESGAEGYGAIYLYQYADVTNIQSDFTENKGKRAGAIYLNSDHNSIGTITGKFIGNESTNSSGNMSAGAIYNNVSTITSISGEFTDNSTTAGAGALGNSGTIGTITADFTNNKKTSGSGGSSSAGALDNSGSITTITGDFTGNSSNSHAGAIYNVKTIETINGDFAENVAGDNGGAIYNKGTNAVISTIIGDFVDNESRNSGSAIYNETGSITSITGDFRDNNVTSSGGAIYNKDGTIGLLAKSDSITFYNNKAGSVYNDITNIASTSSATSTINMNAASGKNISFGGTINSGTSGSNGTININNSTDSTERGGQYVFNNTVSYQTINLNNSADVKLGSIKQANGTTTYGSFNYVTLNNMSGTGMLDLRNDHIDTNYASAMTLGTNSAKADLKVALDVSMNEGSTEI